VPTPNYAYEKRQRELAKKRKKEEKASRKTHGGPSDDNQAGSQPAGDNEGATGAPPAEPPNAA
jgi:hypothetical protein